LACALLVASSLVACDVVDIGDPAPASPTGPGEAATPEAPLAPPAIKTQRWDLANPRPIGVDIHGVWGTWLVGQAGAVLRFDGKSATSVWEGPIDDVYDHVWASGDDDVWVAGRRGARGYVTVHGKNGVFEVDATIGSRPVHALYGFAKNDVWMAVADGRMMHFDGSKWTERFKTPDGSRLRAIWGLRADDMWSVGDGGTVYRWNGSTFTPHAVEGGKRFFGVWGRAADDVWAVSDGEGKAEIFHFDGTTWAPDTMPLLGGCFGSDLNPTLSDVPEPRGRGMWGVTSGADTVIMASRGGSCRITRDISGNSSSPWEADIEDEGDFKDMWGDRLDTFIAVGARGRIARLRGYNPQVTATQVFPGRRDQLVDVSVGTDGETWARGNDSTGLNDQLFRWTDLGWTPIVDAPRGLFMTAVAVRSATDAWIATEGDVHHWDGKVWEPGVSLGLGAKVERIVIGPDGDGWAIGSAIWRLDAGEWKRVPLPGSALSSPRPMQPTDVWSLGRNDVWLAMSDRTKDGAVMHWDGKSLTTVYEQTGKGGFWGVWASSPKDVYVAGIESMHFDGNGWTKVPVPQSHGVWGADSKNVYFGAWVDGTDAAQILRWNGEQTSIVARHWAGHTPVAFAHSRDVGFAVGDDGLTFRLVNETKAPR
jgi:hypothetical protein